MTVDIRDHNRLRSTSLEAYYSIQANGLVISGQLKSGKNHMQIGRNGRHYPLPAWAIWRDGIVLRLRTQRRGMFFDSPCFVNVKYWRSDNRRRDVPGMMDAICHCLERAGIVKDDSLLTNWVWRDMGLDRENPRAEVFIYGA